MKHNRRMLSTPAALALALLLAWLPALAQSDENRPTAMITSRGTSAA